MSAKGLPILGRCLAYAGVFAVCVVWLPACSEDSPQGEMLEEGPDAGDGLSKEVSVKVGRAGATVKARGVTLEIPEDALDKEVIITAKSTGLRVPKNVTEKQVSDVFEFGPKGTTFKKDVTVRFATEKEERAATVFFTKQGTSDFEKIASVSKGAEVSAKVRHFSQGFVGLPLSSEAVEPGLERDAGASDAASPEGGTVREPDAEIPVEWTTIKVQTQDRVGARVEQTWAAFQDGDERFQFLAPQELGVYSFAVKSTRFAIIFLCHETNGSTSATAFYRTTQETNYVVPTLGISCAQAPADSSIPVTARVSLNGLYYWRAGQASMTTAISYNGTGLVDMVYQVAGKEADLLFAAGAEAYPLTRMLITRDVTATAPTTLTYDLWKQGVALDQTATAMVKGASASTSLQVLFATRSGPGGILLDAAAAATSEAGAQNLLFSVPPSAVRLATDRFVLLATENEDGTERALTVESAQPTDLYGELPAALSVSFVTLKNPHTVPGFKFDRVPAAQDYVFEARFDESRAVLHEYTLNVEAAWFGSDAGLATDFAFPDLSPVKGFDLRWINAANGAVAKGSSKLLVRSRATEGSRSLRYEAGRSGTF